MSSSNTNAENSDKEKVFVIKEESQKTNNPDNVASLKRKAGETLDASQTSKIVKTESQSAAAAHYNALPEAGRNARYQSPIFFMRNFNNWIKSILLQKFQSRIFKEGQKDGLTVLDLGCGKGGDLLKWQKGKVWKLICTDIADKSVEQCEDRYETNKRKTRGNIFKAEFIVADSSKESLKDKYKVKETLFDLVSSQFVIHYSFESEAQAECMIRNACESIRPGGYFIGTTVNANALRKKLMKSEGMIFGNDIFSVTFQDKDEFKDYATKYDFHLEGVVDCPEHVIQKSVVEKLCAKHGMKLVLWETFSDFFQSNINDHENRKLVYRMKALENFPNRSLNSRDPHAYDHAKRVCDKIYYDSGRRANPRVSTLSANEWEAASVYVAFAFKRTDEEVHARCSNDDTPDEIPLVVNC